MAAPARRIAAGLACLILGLALAPSLAAAPAPGAITVSIDARDVRHRIISVHETLALTGAGGDLVLLYPKWIPGDHAPSGPIERLAGLTIRAAGVATPWRRDQADAFAFHVQAPAGVRRLEIEFQYLAPSADVTDGAVMTRDIVAINWPYLVLYPRGSAVAELRVEPQIRLPEGFRWASALTVQGQPDASAAAVAFAPVSLATLLDSPVYAGAFLRQFDLDPAGQARPMRMSLFADRADRNQPSPEQLAWHRALAREADALFGSRPFNHYDLLVTLSAPFGINGLEHRQSSEVFLHPDYLTDWAGTWDSRYILAHELVHAWNGKWRVPAGLAAPDLNTDLRPDLLWVYEGQTQYWAKVLTARAGIWTSQQALDDLAVNAARYATRPAQAWRSLGDSTRDPILNPRDEAEWRSWQRFQDYYDEGALVWLDVDTQLRTLTHGQKSLDDFARAFFAGGGDPLQTKPYDRADLTAALNRLAPYDWEGLFARAVDQTGAWDPLDGVRRGGYQLTFDERPSPTCTADEARREMHCFTGSIGLIVGSDGLIDSVEWDGPAFRAGLAAGMKLVALDGETFSADRLTAAISRASASPDPIAIVAQDQQRVDVLSLPYHGGLRYPHLVRNAGAPDLIGDILKPKSGAPASP